MNSDWPERIAAPTGKHLSHTEIEHLERYRWATVRVSGRVLDAACGSGYGSALMSERAQVDGIDYDEDVVEVAQRLAPHATIQRGELPEIDYPDDTFDFVVSFETIEHVTRAAEAVAEMYRVLKPGGSLLISTPNGANPMGNTIQNPWHKLEYSLAEFRDLLTEAGFESLDVYEQRTPKRVLHPVVRLCYRIVSRFPVLRRPEWWWDTISHGSPRITEWDGEGDPFFWVVRASKRQA